MAYRLTTTDMRAQALLFDLGGVLVDIDFGRALEFWAPYSSLPLTQLRQRFQIDEHYERHERGEIAAEEYFDHLASTLELTASHGEIEAGWNSIFVGEIAATRALVEAARKSLPCFVLSNTNASHKAHWSKQFPKVIGAFDRVFTSHEMGLRKPERAAFDHICRATDFEAQSIVFFDDLPENVRGATEAGLQAVHVQSPTDVATALQRLGISVQRQP